MEDSNFIIAEPNTQDQNWIVDSPLSDNSLDLNRQYINKSIISELQKRKFIFEGLQTQNLPEMQFDEDIEATSPNFKLPDFTSQKPRYYNSYITNSQRWIGHITTINDSTFEARLVDLNNPSTFEMGNFDFAEVTHEDRPLLELGAVFYWSVGYATLNGQVIKQSLVRFQRLPPWNEANYDESIDRSRRLFLNLKWDEDP